MEFEALWHGDEPFRPTDDLRHTLRLDSWDKKMALWALMGVQIDLIKFEHELDVDGYPSSTEIVSITSFDYQQFKKSDEIPFDLSAFDLFLLSNERLNQIWDSGNHTGSNPPNYYVEWAVSKGFLIPWHEWAYKNGLVNVAAPKTQTDGNPSFSVSNKPITAVERNTLLTIIAALCDYSAIKFDDRGAANQIARMTEEIGAAVSDDTVRRWLKQIPDALESRKK